MAPHRLFTPAEAARETGVPVSRLQKLCTAHRIRPIADCVGGRVQLFDTSQVHLLRSLAGQRRAETITVTL